MSLSTQAELRNHINMRLFEKIMQVSSIRKTLRVTKQSISNHQQTSILHTVNPQNLQYPQSKNNSATAHDRNINKRPTNAHKHNKRAIRILTYFGARAPWANYLGARFSPASCCSPDCSPYPSRKASLRFFARVPTTCFFPPTTASLFSPLQGNREEKPAS